MGMGNERHRAAGDEAVWVCNSLLLKESGKRADQLLLPKELRGANSPSEGGTILQENRAPSEGGERIGMAGMKNPGSRRCGGRGLWVLRDRSVPAGMKVHRSRRVFRSGLVGLGCRAGCYFSTPSSLPILVKAATHLSRCSLLWPADTCTRIRAWSLGTTG